MGRIKNDSEWNDIYTDVLSILFALSKRAKEQIQADTPAPKGSLLHVLREVWTMPQLDDFQRGVYVAATFMAVLGQTEPYSMIEKLKDLSEYKTFTDPELKTELADDDDIIH